MKEFFTLEEVAEIAKVSPATVQGWVDKNALQSTGEATLRFERAKLKRFFERWGIESAFQTLETEDNLLRRLPKMRKR